MISQGRDERLDFIRGFLLLLMTLNHFKGWWTPYTWQPFGFVSAAEGFVLVSAITAGLVYTQKQSLKRPLLRALSIYKTHLFVLCLILVTALLAPIYLESWTRWLRPFHLDPERISFWGALLVHQPKYFDILPMYVGFLLLSSLLLVAIRLRIAPLALAISFFVWWWNPNETVRVWLVLNVCGDCHYGYFNPFAWQLIWVCGFMGAYFFIQMKPIRKLTGNPIIVLSSLCVCVWVYLMKETSLVDSIITRVNQSRVDLGWIRLLNLAAFTIVLLAISSRIPRSFRAPVFNLLGRHSLQVFSLHLILLYLLKPMNELLLRQGETAFTTLVVAFTILAMAGLAKLLENKSSIALWQERLKNIAKP